MSTTGRKGDKSKGRERYEGVGTWRKRVRERDRYRVGGIKTGREGRQKIGQKDRRERQVDMERDR